MPVPGFLVSNEGTTTSGLGCPGIAWALGPRRGSLGVCVYSFVLSCLLPRAEVRDRSALFASFFKIRGVRWDTFPRC